MSTHAYIGQQNEDGTVIGIYVHGDGHLDFTGYTLLRHYAGRDDTEDLLALGDLSYVWDTPAESLAYARDMGEAGTGARLYANSAEFLEDAADRGAANRAYLQRKDGNWHIADGSGPNGKPRWPRLTRVIREAGLAPA